MKSSLIAALAVVLISTYSFVYACREARSVHTVKAPASPTSISTHVTVLSAQAHAIVLCKTVEAAAPVLVDVDLPVEVLGSTRAIHIRGTAVEKHEECATPVDTVRHTARVAATLGRAFVTTVGAVFGSLLDAALSARAALV